MSLRDPAAKVSAASPAGPTKAVQIHKDLRRQILTGRLAPGQRLKFDELREVHRASIGVIREALVTLAEQGLVTVEPRIGCRVTAMAADDLVDLCETRVIIEGSAFRLAIENGDLEWESQVLAAHHTLDGTPLEDVEAAVTEQWNDAHRVFHRALLSGCPNRRLYKLAEALRDTSEVYRAWSQTVGRGARDVAAEHLALRDAAVRRDAERGVRLLSEHLRRTAEFLTASDNPTVEM